MEKLSVGQKKLIAEFLCNIGVVWFVAGVVNPFISRPNNWLEIIVSFIWGIVFSAGFLRVGLVITKGVKS